MQLQDAKPRFEQRGIKLAAISYDSPAILQDFARRHRIDYPLLSDPDSKVIARYRVLNEAATGITKGMAHPGFYYLDARGVIRETYFETRYTDRVTPNNLITKLFPELVAEVSRAVEAPHLTLTLTQSDRIGIPGSRVSLGVVVTLPPRTHVYSPDVKGGYIPIALAIAPSPEIEVAPITYPSARILYLDAIKEQVPVFDGTFRITQDVTIAASKAMVESLGASGRTIEVAGVFKYQACDDRVCYAPSSIPVTWRLQVLPLDRERSPESIRHQ